MDDLTTKYDNTRAASNGTSDTAESAAGSIYVIAAHPAWRESRVNRPMMQAAKAVPTVAVRDLYSTYPDYAIDVPREQQAMERASLIVLLHPIQWYSMPALQKLWLDDVLTYGWAYGDSRSVLRGKDLWLVATTGGPASSYHPQSYNRYFFDAFLPPYEQTAALCGMRFLPPLVLHGSHTCPPEEVDAHVATFRERLQSYPDWPEMEDLEQCPACVVPMNDRPVHEAEDGGNT
ncbi:MAG: NAD(P)H dehydrogenase [Comamonadaceae bacterium]|nr:MAG: NAD(P)H dehydrogenase [Comamonadaceae bacterium]